MFVNHKRQLSGLFSQMGYIKKKVASCTNAVHAVFFRWIIKSINSSKVRCRRGLPETPDDEEQNDRAESGKGTILLLS